MSGVIRNHKDLFVWQKAMDLAVATYGLSESFPKTELYGLTSQIRRAAVSIPSNIAEGHARRRTKEYLHHLDIAYGSLAELRTQVYIAVRLNYVSGTDTADLNELADDVGRMLNGLIRSLSNQLPDANWRVAEESAIYASDNHDS